MAPVRMALVGLGMVAETHVRALRDLSDRVEIAYAFSPTTSRRQAFAETHGIPACGALETILEDATVDAVVILTPANTHGDIAARCAQAGKHVLLEKPVEITTERATRLVETCERAGIVLGVVLQNRFRPASERLAVLLAEGRLGAIVGHRDERHHVATAELL